MDYGVPLGHRFRALKLWFVLRSFGRERIETMLREHIQWARRLADLIAADPRFEVVAPVPFSVVCFRYRGSDDQNKQIMDRVNESGSVFISRDGAERQTGDPIGVRQSRDSVGRRGGGVGSGEEGRAS